jgi:mRNA interferase MazF
MVARPRKRRYVPERGDAVWLQFDPRLGHEQAGRRPALVLSPAAYNGRVGLALLSPITSQVKGYPFEVAVPPGFKIGGVVLADQLRSLDWAARKAQRIGALPAAVVEEVIEKVELLLRG